MAQSVLLGQLEIKVPKESLVQKVQLVNKVDLDLEEALADLEKKESW
jgi:hypothetical protein